MKRVSLYTFLTERMDIVLIPKLSRGLKFSVRPYVLVLLAILWLAVTLYSAFIVTREIDYNFVKADNKVMKAKLAMIAEELKNNRQYLMLVRKTDQQMRQMLGMKGGKYINMPGGIEEGKESRAITFSSIFSKDSKDIDEQAINDTFKETTAAAEEQLASYQEIAWFYTNQKNSSNATPSIKPTKNYRITSNFGYRLTPFPSYHYGIDLAAKANAPIYVTADGVVRQTGWALGYGQAVLVDHSFGYSTLYGHLADIRVKKGDRVKRGQLIASMGTTGRSTGVHLHYEVWKDGTPVNPKDYL